MSHVQNQQLNYVLGQAKLCRNNKQPRNLQGLWLPRFISCSCCVSILSCLKGWPSCLHSGAVVEGGRGMLACSLALQASARKRHLPLLLNLQPGRVSWPCPSAWSRGCKTTMCGWRQRDAESANSLKTDFLSPRAILVF